MQEALREIEKKYNGLVVFKKLAFPLSETTFRATEAVLCVKNYSKRKLMSDFIYKSQARWRNSRYPESLWLSFLKKIDANIASWKKCLNQKESVARINRSRDLGLGLGVRSTPTFFIGNKKIEGSKSLALLRKTIKKEVLKLKKRVN